jgi:hypothetical protein
LRYKILAATGRDEAASVGGLVIFTFVIIGSVGRQHARWMNQGAFLINGDQPVEDV